MQKTAESIVQAFRSEGFEAYYAGGSVRDFLMEREPNDYDIATSANPDEIERVLQHAHIIPIGRQFGVMMAVVDGHQFEIATFRSDSSASDGRRPDAVLFTSAKEDALRRDFTINGLFYDPLEKKVLDYIDGQKDIHEGIVRFIGEPHERIKEDHLRLLRAVRFKNNFSFRYADSTEKALRDLPHLVNGLSGERVQEEMTKMLLHPHRASSMEELHDFGVMAHLLPEVAACEGIPQPTQYHQEGDVLRHLFKSLHELPQEWVTPKEAPPNKELAWAVFLHDIGKPDTIEKKEDRIHFNGHAHRGAELTEKLLRRLKFSKLEMAKIVWLIEHHMSVGLLPQMRRAHKVNYFLNPWFEDLMRLHYCDESGSQPVNLELYEANMKEYEEFKNEKLLEDHFKPKLSGEEIMEVTGLKPGPKIKEILDALREAQIEGEVNDKKEAEEFVRRQKSMLS